MASHPRCGPQQHRSRQSEGLFPPPGSLCRWSAPIHFQMLAPATVQGLEILPGTCYNRGVGEILLIAADWHFRALVRAQLLDEGYAVRAWPSVEIALAYLVRGGEQPRLTILDAQGIDVDAQALSDLWRLIGGASLILCGGMLDRKTLSQEDLPPMKVLLRPFRIGDLVEQVRKVLPWPGDGPTRE